MTECAIGSALSIPAALLSTRSRRSPVTDPRARRIFKRPRIQKPAQIHHLHQLAFRIQHLRRRKPDILPIRLGTTIEVIKPINYNRIHPAARTALLLAPKSHPDSL